jgi:Haloacid dehalogenase-like hydrolase
VGRLTGIETVLLDLDGALYVGSQIVPGAPQAVRWLRSQGLTVRFTTNTDSIAPAALADRLARLGFPAAEDELVTPVAVAAPPVRVGAADAGAGRGRRRVCWELEEFLAGPGEPATHVLVADPSFWGDLRRPGRRLPGRPGRGGAGPHPGQPGRPARRRRVPGHRRVGAAAGVRDR